MLKSDSIFHYPREFELESGGKLPVFQLKYTTYGRLNKERDNVVWVCHALTGSSDFTDWWGGFFDSTSLYSPSEYFVICANTLGGCYGSTGPLSLNPSTGLPYLHDFPQITTRDAIRAFDLLRKHLQIQKVHTLIGGSLGGQQALEWAIEQPDVFKNLVAVATNAVHSPWGIAFNEAQRMAIAADPTWQENNERAGIEGLKAARAIAMISYRAYDGYGITQAEKNHEKLDGFRSASYQQYQGQKLANRFNAYTYWLLTKMMDSHNVGRGRKSIEAALQKIKADTLITGIETDILFPVSEQKFLTANILNSKYKEISSHFGHDGFLVEFDQLKRIVRNFLREPALGS